MRFLRNIAYAIIVLCAIGCGVILTYSGKGNKDNEKNNTVAVDKNLTSIDVVVENGEVDIEDLKDAASAIISDVKENVAEVVSSVSEAAKENKSGEISYAEIVRLQEEEVALQMIADVSASNFAHGIVVSKPTTPTTPEEPASPMKYVVNASTGKIHRVGCLLEPVGSNAKRFESLGAVKQAGYSEKCTVCSP